MMSVLPASERYAGRTPEQLTALCEHVLADLCSLAVQLRGLADSLHEAEFRAWREGREDETADLAAADVSNLADEAQTIADLLA